MKRVYSNIIKEKENNMVIKSARKKIFKEDPFYHFASVYFLKKKKKTIWKLSILYLADFAREHQNQHVRRNFLK